MKLQQEEGGERAELTCKGTQVLFFMCVCVCVCLFLKHHHIPPQAPSSGLSRPVLLQPGTAQGGDGLKSPQGIVVREGGKGKGFDFHSLGLFSPPSSPACPLPFCHIVLSLNQTFTKGIRGRLLINSKAGWKRGNQPWCSAEGHSCSGGPGGSKSPG